MKLTKSNIQATIGRLEAAWKIVYDEVNDLHAMGLRDEPKILASALVSIEFTKDMLRGKVHSMETLEFMESELCSLCTDKDKDGLDHCSDCEKKKAFLENAKEMK